MNGVRTGPGRTSGERPPRRTAPLLVVVAVLAAWIGTAAVAPAPAGAAPAPTVSSLVPNKGRTAGGDTVVITGTGFTGATEVRFGPYAVAPSFTVDSDTQITVTSPSGYDATVNVWVTTPAGTNPNTSTSWFHYIPPPYVTRVSPVAGPSTGGTELRITGSSLTPTLAVSFNGVPAASFRVEGKTGYLYATTPPLPTGPADVVVQTPYGTSGSSGNDEYLVIDPGVPVLTERSPATGSEIGGVAVTITGTDLDLVTAVRFGGTPAASFVIQSPGQLVAVTPPHAVGTVPIALDAVAGTSPATRYATFEYTPQPPPTLHSVSPNYATELGGTPVTLTGVGFTGATKVEFGLGNPAPSFTVLSDSTIVTVSPPMASAQIVNVRVTTPLGLSTTGWSSQWVYTGPPKITALSPAAGPASGGTTVTITGTRLGATTRVDFGTVPSPSITLVDPYTVTAVAPPLPPGDHAVKIVAFNGTSAPTPAAVYHASGVPTVGSLTPWSGSTAGGTTITVKGTGFTAATEVRFGNTPATSFVVVDDTTVTAVTPAGTAGSAPVRVTTPGGTSTAALGSYFTWVAPGAPIVASVDPSRGTTAGGYTVVLTGAGFTGATSVRFGATAATFSVDSDTRITATVPARPAGLVTVWVGGPGGTSSTGPRSWFTYL